jgi:retinoblastoma-associated protein
MCPCVLRADSVVFTDLKEVLEANSSAEPGQRLLQFFKKCDINPLDRIKEILTELGSYFLNHFSCVTGDPKGKAAMKYFLLSTRLYYRVLESLLVKEAVRLPDRNFSFLLAKESFHHVLIACSVEVVMFCYGNTKTFRGLSDIVCFPWIIDVFHIEPFDLLRMTEMFILSEPLLSLDLINHLHQIEASIIDTLAWEGKSKLFQFISDIDLVKCLTEAEGSHLFIAHTVQNSLNGYSKIPVLDLFYRKVRQLTYCRLQLLCSSLDISADLEEKIWTLLQFVFTCMPSLVKNRCLDQILLCSIYGICKVVNQELQFKLIVTYYRQLPSASPEVYRHVFIQPGQYNSVIVLYNVVFMPALKAVLLTFLPDKQAVVTLPPPLFSRAPYADRPYKATTGLNVYVSPMRASSREDKATPRTKALYSFGDSIWSPCRSASLQFINDMMKKHCQKKDKGPLKKCLKFTESSDPQTLTLRPSRHQQSTVPCVVKPAGWLSEQITAGQSQTDVFSSGFLQQLTDLVHDRSFFESALVNQ